MGKFRICFFTQQYGYLWSGLGTYATCLIDALAERGYPITLVTHEEPRRAVSKVHENVQLITLPQTKWDPSIGHWFSLSRKYAAAIARHKEIKACRIFHFTDAREALWLPFVGQPAVGTMHDYYFADASKNPFYYSRFYGDWVRRWLYYNAVHFLEPMALRRLAAVICNTSFVRDRLVERYLLPADKLHVVYLGLKQEMRNAHVKIPALEGSPVVLFVGANFQRKGLPTLIRAVQVLKEVFPAVAVYVIGKDANEQKMKKMCDDLGVGPHFRFIGWRSNEEVKTFYERADLFVLPSLIEGFGLAFLEAMNAGIPVIGGDAGGTRELITDGVNGLMAVPGNAEQLAAKMRLLLEKVDLKEKLIKNAKATVQRFSLERMVEGTVALYEKLISIR